MWWAWLDLNLRPHPETEIARVATGSAAPRRAELGRATRFSSIVAAPAMGVLSGIEGLACDLTRWVCRVSVDRGRRSDQRVGAGQATFVALVCLFRGFLVGFLIAG
jgi:hypothetical protein